MVPICRGPSYRSKPVANVRWYLLRHVEALKRVKRRTKVTCRHTKTGSQKKGQPFLSILAWAIRLAMCFPSTARLQSTEQRAIAKWYDRSAPRCGMEMERGLNSGSEKVNFEDLEGSKRRGAQWEIFSGFITRARVWLLGCLVQIGGCGSRLLAKRLRLVEFRGIHDMPHHPTKSVTLSNGSTCCSYNAPVLLR